MVDREFVFMSWRDSHSSVVHFSVTPDKLASETFLVDANNRFHMIKSFILGGKDQPYQLNTWSGTRARMGNARRLIVGSFLSEDKLFFLLRETIGKDYKYNRRKLAL